MKERRKKRKDERDGRAVLEHYETISNGYRALRVLSAADDI